MALPLATQVWLKIQWECKRGIFDFLWTFLMTMLVRAQSKDLGIENFPSKFGQRRRTGAASLLPACTLWSSKSVGRTIFYRPWSRPLKIEYRPPKRVKWLPNQTAPPTPTGYEVVKWTPLSLKDGSKPKVRKHANKKPIFSCPDRLVGRSIG